MKEFLLSLAFLLSAAAGSVFSQSLYADFMKAHAEGDHANCIKHGSRLVTFTEHPDPLYKLAQCYSQNDQPDESLKILNRLADWGLTYQIAAAARLEKLRGSKDYPALAAKFEKNLRPVNNSQNAFVLADSRLIPESVAVSPDRSKFYVGSLAKNKIVEYAAGRERDFIVSDQDGIWSVVGMKISPDGKELWACSYSERGASNGAACIFVFELGGGKLKAKYVSDGKTGQHLFNDLVFDPDGRKVYFTDSKAGKVLRLDKETGQIDPLVDRNFIYPNGVTLDEKTGALFVADFAGLTRIDLKTKRIDKVDPSNLTFLQGVDGLYFYDGSLVAVQNPGGGADRVVRFYLDAAQTKVTGVKILQSFHPDFNIPTTGAVAGDDFYYIANSFVSSLKPDGTIADADKLQKPIIKKINLRAASR